MSAVIYRGKDLSKKFNDWAPVDFKLGPFVTNWIYAALMLLPFALLLPIGHALASGHVWLALIPLPLVGVLVNRFVHEPWPWLKPNPRANRADSIPVQPAA